MSHTQNLGINKILVEIIVQHDSVFENSLVKDLHWPGKSLLVAIKRGEVELIPKGDTKIMVGDYLVVLTDINCESKIREKLEKLNLRPQKKVTEANDLII